MSILLWHPQRLRFLYLTLSVVIEFNQNFGGFGLPRATELAVEKGAVNEFWQPQLTLQVRIPEARLPGRVNFPH